MQPECQSRDVVADLHVHTQTSDGELALGNVPHAAKRAGVEVVAITDHDRIDADLSEPITTHDGIRVITGIELRVATTSQRIDLLGYGVSRSRLEGLIEHLQQDRIERMRRMVARVESRLGITPDIVIEKGVGRPHLARAIERHPDTCLDAQAAFATLIGDGKPCYVPRDIPDFDEGVATLRAACRFVGLAHPFRYEDPSAAIELARTLDGIERWYPYGRPIDEQPIRDALAAWDLVATGGSDAHDVCLGRAGLDRDETARFMDACGFEWEPAGS